MDALSSSISPLNNVSTLHPPKSLLSLHQYSNAILPSSKSNSRPLSNKAAPPAATRRTSFLHHPPFLESLRAPPSKKHPSKHEGLLHNDNPVTGYAVALLDAARSDDAVEVVKMDAERLTRWLRNEQLRCVMDDPLMGSTEKGRIVKEVVKKGGFHRYLVKLVNLLLERRKIGILSHVLMEFGKIHHLLSNSIAATQVVLVSAEVKMGKGQMLGIAKTIHNLTGAKEVKVRQLASSQL